MPAPRAILSIEAPVKPLCANADRADSWIARSTAGSRGLPLFRRLDGVVFVMSIYHTILSRLLTRAFPKTHDDEPTTAHNGTYGRSVSSGPAAHIAGYVRVFLIGGWATDSFACRRFSGGAVRFSGIRGHNV
jgi:hypothetical protein